jgi:signal transduction histidine kinase
MYMPLNRDPMTEQVKTLKVGIVGGGPGCKAIIDIIFAERLSQLRMKLIGVACTNPKAAGYRYAQEKGFFTTDDFRDLYKLPGLNMIVELTGRRDVANEICQTKPDHVRLIDHIAARLFWDIFRIEEERLAERQRTEESLRKAHDELERRVEERTFELSKSNALLKQEVTERRRVEKELRKKNQELENFVSVVSHELKTPIIGVQGFSSRLLRNYQEKLDKKAKGYLEQIQVSATRMESFVSELLALARNGQVVSSFENVSSFKLVKDVGSRLHPRLKKKGIKLVITDHLPTICCDGDGISRVVENLLVNAIKFMGDYKNPKIEIGYEDKGQFHQFSVKDNGIGIDRKYHQEIFDMFRQLKEVTDEEGTGIGLAIVGRILKHHGGKIWVESEKGKGATFYYTLPKNPEPVTPPAETLCRLHHDGHYQRGIA